MFPEDPMARLSLQAFKVQSDCEVHPASIDYSIFLDFGFSLAANPSFYSPYILSLSSIVELISRCGVPFGGLAASFYQVRALD